MIGVSIVGGTAVIIGSVNISLCFNNSTDITTAFRLLVTAAVMSAAAAIAAFVASVAAAIAAAAAAVVAAVGVAAAGAAAAAVAVAVAAAVTAAAVAAIAAAIIAAVVVAVVVIVAIVAVISVAADAGGSFRGCGCCGILKTDVAILFVIALLAAILSTDSSCSICSLRERGRLVVRVHASVSIIASVVLAKVPARNHFVFREGLLWGSSGFQSCGGLRG